MKNKVLRELLHPFFNNLFSHFLALFRFKLIKHIAIYKKNMYCERVCKPDFSIFSHFIKSEC